MEKSEEYKADDFVVCVWSDPKNYHVYTKAKNWSIQDGFLHVHVTDSLVCATLARWTRVEMIHKQDALFFRDPLWTVKASNNG